MHLLLLILILIGIIVLFVLHLNDYTMLSILSILFIFDLYLIYLVRKPNVKTQRYILQNTDQDLSEILEQFDKIFSRYKL